MTPTEKTNPAAYQAACQQILAIIDGAQAPADPTAASEPGMIQTTAPGAPRARRSHTDAHALVFGRLADLIEPPDQPPVTKSGAAEAGVDETAERQPIAEELRRDALNGELAHLPMTDLGNAERFRKRFGHLFKWTAALGWHYWDGRRWARKSAEGRVRMAAHETVRAIQDEAKAVGGQADAIAAEFAADEIEQAEQATKKKKPKKDKGKRAHLQLVGDDFTAEVEAEKPALDKRKIELFLKFKRLRGLGLALSGWGRDSEMNSKITPIDKHAGPYLAVEIEAFDADPWAINVANGTLVVDRAAPGMIRFKSHDPADLITKISPVAYDPREPCPIFDAFLARIQPDEDNRRFLIDWLGYSLTGDAAEQQLAIFHGSGANGKGTLVRICSHVAGDYAKATPIETFLAEASPRNASQPTPERAALPGVRMLTASEPKKGAKLDEGFIKLVTGNDIISARDLNKSQFEFMPVFKLTISANNKPRINDQTDGIWRRMNLVPFDVKISRAEWDLKLDEKLRGEASGVLNMLLDGLRNWLVNGLKRSAASEKATAKYREDSDELGRFLGDCVEAVPGERVQSSLLHELFIAWAKATGAAEWSNTGFTNAMKDRDYTTYKSNVMFYLDIRAKKTVNDFVDHLGHAQVGGADERERAATQARASPDDDEVGF